MLALQHRHQQTTRQITKTKTKHQLAHQLGKRGDRTLLNDENEYSQDILEWLQVVETRTLAIPEYMSNQNQISWKMRKTLILWLIQVCFEFKLSQSSLYLSINILDRITSKRSILARQYQLLGLSCLWISAKICENHGGVPTIKKLLHICCQTYTSDNFITMERFILIELGCYLNHVSCEDFVAIFSVRFNLDQTCTSLARYLVEQSLIHKRFVGVRPSLIARAAINLASCLVHGIEVLAGSASEHDLICQAHLRDCLRQQPLILVKKFGVPEYQFCSRLVEGFQQPRTTPLYSTIASTNPTPPSTTSSPHIYFHNSTNTLQSTTSKHAMVQTLTPPKDPDDPGPAPCLVVGGVAPAATAVAAGPFSFGFFGFTLPDTEKW